LIGFVIAYGEIFLEYSYNILEKIFKKSSNLKKKSSYYFIKVHVENLAKNVIFKKIEIHLQVLFNTKKEMLQFLMCAFVDLLFIGLISN